MRWGSWSVDFWCSSLFKPNSCLSVVIGMSGGVDSSVAAKLLADQDYDLSAVFMRNWDTRDELGRDSGLQTGCEWEKDWQDVQSICRTLDIPCKLVDLSKEYWNRVFEPALEMWENGQTPNPDVWCNRHIKFGHLLHTLQIVESNSWFATGHYARKAWSSPTNGVPPRPKLLRFAADPIKDQSLFLSSIKESALSRALFPLGDAQLTAHLKNVPSGFPETHGPLNKSHVKALAKHWGLVTAEKEESMGLCFVGERGKFHNFICASSSTFMPSCWYSSPAASYLPPKPGPIVQIQNDPSTRTPIERVVGTHSGLWNYTIGQNARVPGLPQKTFVSRKNADSNTLFVVFGGTNEALYAKTIWLDNASWIWQDSPPVKLENLDVGWTGWIKARHRMVLKRCRVVVEKFVFFDCLVSPLSYLQGVFRIFEGRGRRSATWDCSWPSCGFIRGHGRWRERRELVSWLCYHCRCILTKKDWKLRTIQLDLIFCVLSILYNLFVRYR